MAPDEESVGGSRIVFRGKAGEDKELPAPEFSTPGAVGDTDHGHGPSSECFPAIRIDVHVDSNAFLRQGRTLLTLEMEKSSRQNNRVVRVDIVFVFAFS